MELYKIKRRFSKSSKFEPLVTEDLEDIELEEKRCTTYQVLMSGLHGGAHYTGVPITPGCPLHGGAENIFYTWHPHVMGTPV